MKACIYLMCFEFAREYSICITKSENSSANLLVAGCWFDFVRFLVVFERCCVKDFRLSWVVKLCVQHASIRRTKETETDKLYETAFFFIIPAAAIVARTKKLTK
jgi:hypothetical protein